MKFSKFKEKISIALLFPQFVIVFIVISSVLFPGWITSRIVTAVCLLYVVWLMIPIGIVGSILAILSGKRVKSVFIAVIHIVISICVFGLAFWYMVRA